jgi:GNAT superfamily N-acetyltransferase
MNSGEFISTMDDYDRYPKLPGWKYECFGGVIRATPSMHSIATTLEVTPRTSASPCDLVSPDEIPREDLVCTFIASFKDSVEFFNWTLVQVEEHANKWVNALLDGKRGRMLAISRVAVIGNSVVGAALFRDEDDIPFLDLLYVLPDWQRKGIASAMVAQAVNTLYEARIPVLTSRYDLANTSSRDWHHRFGFKDSPGWLASRHLRAYFRQELHRRTLMGDLDDAERRRLQQEIEHWSNVIISLWGDDV